MGVRRLWAAALVVGTTRAQNCPAGSYADGGSCVVCPAGFYAKNSGSTSCNDCNAGKYISDDGVDITAHDEKSDCLVCPAGAYAAVDGATGCELCPAGSYLDDGAAAPDEAGTSKTAHDALDDCFACPVGTYQTAEGSWDCLDCPAGRYGDVAGSWGDHDELADCVICPAGTSGACAEGYFCAPGSTSPTAALCGAYIDPPAAAYCPAGAAAPTPAAEGEYTTPRWGSAYARTAVASCAVNAGGLYTEYCPGDGSRFADLVSLDCPATLDLPDLQMRNLPYLSPKDAHLLLDVHKDRLPLLDEEEKKSKASKDAALSRKRTKRVQVGADGFAAAYRSGRLREAAAELVFEYNTIECTLLSASIMICIFGVMLASEYVADGKHPAARSALVHATLVVIALSLLYFAAVLWHEIISKIFPMLNFSCLGIFADDQQKTKDAPDDDVLDDGVEMAEAIPGRFASAKDDRDDAQTLMTVEEQIAMQKVVAGLQRDNGVLKKRIADLETQGREKVAKQYSKVKKKAIGASSVSTKQRSNTVGAQDAGYDDGGGDATFGIDVGFDDGDEPRARSNTENPMRHRSGTAKNAHV